MLKPILIPRTPVNILGYRTTSKGYRLRLQLRLQIESSLVDHLIIKQRTILVV